MKSRPGTIRKHTQTPWDHFLLMCTGITKCVDRARKGPTGSLNALWAELILTVQRDLPRREDFDPFYHNTAVRSHNINIRAHTIALKISL